jgi:erythromycin esterase
MSDKYKAFIITICIFIQLLTFFSCKVGDSQPTEPPETEIELTEQQKRLIQELNDLLIPLGASPLELTDNELSFLDQLSFAKIVGLGEATHGTREFFQMKHRIFQYLVEHHNHKAFGFEADFAECIYLNNYVTKGEGDLLNLMKTYMHFWTWRTEEVRELLEWMKNYNTGKNDEEKIHYFGFDCQFTILHPSLIREYLEPLLPGLWETASPILEQVKSLSNSDYGGMSEENYNTIKSQLESLEDQYTANKDQLVANSSTSEYEITRQLFRTLRQAFIVRYTYSGNSNDNTNWRDRYMAENALWIADFFGQDTKISLWAHNAHVAKNAYFGVGGAMGYNLKTALSDLYQVVGFGFSQGKFTAVGQGRRAGIWVHEITDEPRQNSVNILFHNAEHPNFAFHLDAIPAGSEWSRWLTEPVLFLWIGSVFNGNPFGYYKNTDLRVHYNWIIYFDTTNESSLIPLY